MRPVTISVPKYTSPPAGHGITFNASEPNSTHHNPSPGNQRGRAGQPGARTGEADVIPAVRPRQMVRHRLLRVAGLSRRGGLGFFRRKFQPGRSFAQERARPSSGPRTGVGLCFEQPLLDHPRGGICHFFVSGLGDALSVAELPGQIHVPALRGAEQGGSRRAMEQIRARRQQSVLVPPRAGVDRGGF